MGNRPAHPNRAAASADRSTPQFTSEFEMKNHASQAGSGPQPSIRLMNGFRSIGRILVWVTALFAFSEEQLEQAGVHLSRRLRTW
jgi:hypothetical protein